MDIALCCFDLNVHALQDGRIVGRDFLAFLVPNRKSERDGVARHNQGFLRRFALCANLRQGRDSDNKATGRRWFKNNSVGPGDGHPIPFATSCMRLCHP
jgi:hypothetical protein